MRGDIFHEVLQYSQSQITAFFRVELGGKNISFLERRGKRNPVFGPANLGFFVLSVVRMDKIELRIFRDSGKERAGPGVGNAVPANLRDLYRIRKPLVFTFNNFEPGFPALFASSE